MCDQLVSFDDLKVLTSSSSKFHLISRNQTILNKYEASYHYVCLISYTNILSSYMTSYYHHS